MTGSSSSSVSSASSSADDHVYAAITDVHDDARWAFGTGFDDPLSGVDTTVPSTVDGADLAAYCLMLGDDALIMSHRLQEWATLLPELEDEVAVANIALDLLGQARLLLARAGHAEGSSVGSSPGSSLGSSPGSSPGSSLGSRGEDELAYFRDEPQFRNVWLAEIDNGDFAHAMARLLVFATWRLAVLSRLVTSIDPVLAAIAAKGVKEVTYHRDYAARWVVRLGDGTPLSTARMRDGLAAVWPYVDELFVTHPLETRLVQAGVAVAPATVRGEFDDVLAQVLAAATLDRPTVPPLAGGGRDGVHTEAMAPLLGELQGVARAHPEATW